MVANQGWPMSTNWHMLMSTVKHRPVDDDFGVCGHHCFPPSLGQQPRTEKTVPLPPTHIPVAGFKTVFFSAPHVQLSVFDLRSLKLIWPASSTAKLRNNNRTVEGNTLNSDLQKRNTLCTFFVVMVVQSSLADYISA